ncbi:hypothetical protein N656DRAFT_9754 [Canariomyces notabilis]|uniref:Uncharacterized protein n=1 Tax=Canariomyces notabilis TaxID=2074819 RepID=A0AAN6YWW9_9PEZI|nr:hypothetical protein N656DRAFT_9754 [Canariomyces arenarius]
MKVLIAPRILRGKFSGPVCTLERQGCLRIPSPIAPRLQPYGSCISATRRRYVRK